MKSIEHAVVTGARGFIGRALVRSLCDQGIEVLALGREGIESVDHPACRTFVADIETPGELDQYVTQHSVVFHLAAHASVAGSVRDPMFDFDVNVRGFLNVLESVRRSGASLIFPSSSAVYDPTDNLPHAENALRRPSSPYAAAKVAAEAYCDAYHRCYDLDVKIIRLFNVYGPGMTRFAIRDFYQKIKRNPHRLEILGEGDQTRDYLYIDDTIESILCVATKGNPGEDYNVAAGVPVKTIDLARQVAATMGYPDIKITAKGESFPGDVPRWYANIEKIRQLGFEPCISLDEGLRRTIDWFERSDPQANLSPRVAQRTRE